MLKQATASLRCAILDMLRSHKRSARPSVYATLRDVYDSSAGPLDISIIDFHVCLVELDRMQTIRLVPWGQPRFRFDTSNERYALTAGREFL